MNDICRDNRFEIIDRAKADLLDSTNIHTSPKEMEALDNFLFRCWQMGWLDRYDETDGKPKMEKWKIEIEGNGWNEWYVFNCPSCGARIKDNMGYHEWKFNYCPNCGTKMEGRKE